MQASPAPLDPRPRPARRYARRVAIGLVAALVIYAMVLGVAAPPLVRHFAARQVSEKLGRVAVIDDVSINPFTLAATVKGFRVFEPDGKTPFVAFDALDVDASASSLYRFAPVVDALTLTGLEVNVVREAKARFNFSDIVARLEREAQAAKARGEAKEEGGRFSIANVRLVGASIEVDDRPNGEKHRVADMSIAIPFISNLPAHRREYVQPAFSASVNGAAMKLTGETRPFENSLRTHFNVHLDGVDVRRYLDYLPAALPVTVDSGLADARIEVRFIQAPGKDPSIDIAGTAALRDLAVSTAEGRLAELGRLDADVASFDPIRGKVVVKSVRLTDARGLQGDAVVALFEANGIDVDLRQRVVRVASVASRDGVFAVKRGADGAIVLPRRVAPAPGSGEPAPPAPASPPWQVDVASATLGGYQLSLADAAVKPAASHRMGIESLTLRNLTTRDGFSGKLAGKLTVGRAGRVDVESDFILEPLRVDATLDARNLDLVPLRAYVADFPTVGLKSGAASARGKLALGGKPDALRISWQGTAEVAQLATVDTAKREDLLNWKSVRASTVELDVAPGAPLSLGVGEVVVDRIYSRLVVNPDGTLNVQALRTGAPPAKGPAAPQPSPRKVRIDRVTFVDGRLDVTDNFIRPNYSADVAELQGSVTGLSSQPESRATVDLKGRYDRSSPVVIAGTVNPLRGDLFLDLAAKGADIELPRLTAYSQRYAGYGITGGKLTLDVKYHLDGGKLEGRNKVLIDQLTFGDKVDSPEATKLPVLFAVNLLKDSKGQINLELPVSGSLDDPQFDVAALAMQLFGTLLKKAVTSPFSLLSAALGGGAAGKDGEGGDLAFVEYTPGGADLEERSRAKLESLAKALRERPGLTLELTAQTDAKRDGDALRRAELQRRLDAMRAADKVAGDDARYLKALLAREKIEVPTTATASPPAAIAAAGGSKGQPAKAPELTAAEMEALLLARIEVGDAELGELARKRGEGARSWLVAEGRLAADRVVMAPPGGAATAQGARVAFSLR